MKSLCRKLKSRAGETISEVLIALLISSLGLVMLAAMITASARTITKSREVLETYYSDSTPESSKLTLSLKENDSAAESIQYSATYVERELSGKDIDYYYIP